MPAPSGERVEENLSPAQANMNKIERLMQRMSAHEKVERRINSLERTMQQIIEAEVQPRIYRATRICVASADSANLSRKTLSARRRVFPGAPRRVRAARSV